MITGGGAAIIRVMKFPYFRWFAMVGLSFLLLVPGSFAIAAEDAAGTVTRLKGSAVAMQDALPRVLKVGDKILARRRDLHRHGRAPGNEDAG